MQDFCWSINNIFKPRTRKYLEIFHQPLPSGDETRWPWNGGGESGCFAGDLSEPVVSHSGWVNHRAAGKVPRIFSMVLRYRFSFQRRIFSHNLWINVYPFFSNWNFWIQTKLVVVSTPSQQQIARSTFNFPAQGSKDLRTKNPKGCMGLVYLPTFTIKIQPKCRYHIYQSHGWYIDYWCIFPDISVFRWGEMMDPSTHFGNPQVDVFLKTLDDVYLKDLAELSR